MRHLSLIKLFRENSACAALKKCQFFKAKHIKLSSLSACREHMIFRDTEQLQLGIRAGHA